ncbi:hypothetical protein MLD38_001918 [Melastoma candidum]|uniref:Uncharacterized protein n=1 Tax=Melastoma candidum TaxID=119954 RepID=A0ACB9SI28_9MYRT|nr:hypothetical protein MLD38_001918 [Melastoma candidum]
MGVIMKSQGGGGGCGSGLAAATGCLLMLSLLLNVCLVREMMSPRKGLTWTEAAAREAEHAAAMHCSGHGTAYLDSSEGCECHSCYAGPDCSVFLADSCFAEADGGDPLFLEPFWRKHSASSAVLVSGWHRMGYSYSDQTTISKVLEERIRELHSVIGNAVTDGKFILFGVGSTQLIAAAVNSIFAPNSSAPAKVVASIPYYTLYRLQTQLFDSRDCDFKGDTAAWNGNYSGSTDQFIEFVTAPNNPDGQMNKAVLRGPNVRTIHDRAYYWPHFTAISSPDNEDLTIFTISKLTGHAGSRFGWALIKDEDVYERMKLYIQYNTLGVSKDTQLRALKLLEVVLRDGGRSIFEDGHRTMSKRWERLRDAMSVSDRFSLQKIPPERCLYFNETRDPTPAYAWVKCEWDEGQSCYEVLKSGKILGRMGSLFEAEDRYVRLSLIRSDDDFETLVTHLRKLAAAAEDGPKST